MPHPDEGLIHAWLDGELAPVEATRVEALVAADAEWAAAAAEARGLTAASARIVGALDSVPANVIPKGSPRRRPARRWAWRAAAVLALMAGSAVVLKRQPPELPVPTTAVESRKAASPAASAPAASPSVAPPVTAGAKSLVAAAPTVPRRDSSVTPAADRPSAKDKSSIDSKELDSKKSFESARAQSAAAPANELRGAVAAPAPPPIPRPATSRAAETSMEKFIRVRPACFAQREPADSAARIIRLTAAELADSIRLEKFIMNGDTLSALNGSLRALRVRCPEL